MKPTDRNRLTNKREGKVEMAGTVIQPGARIGSYIFLRAIGSGGMAQVLLAKDPNGELVALKVLRKGRFKSGLARFRREFRALSRINHPNVIRVEAYGDLYGHPYIAMEYVDGPDLHTQIRGFRSWDLQQRWVRCEELLVDLCRALAAIHRRGLVHRDLKPSNVLVSKTGTAKLTDFGIVKDLDPSHDPHMSTTLVGTWAYASPEQITGNPIDHRSDLYSLGVILFAMLTGKRPFVANDMAGYLSLHRDRPPPAPREINPIIPLHLDEICQRLLKKAPRDRFQSAQEILYRLEAEERVPVARPGEAWEPPLVARSLELEAINNAIGGLTASRGSAIMLEGDDGCGKSRLLQEAIERCRTVGLPFNLVEYQPNSPVFATMLRVGHELISELGQRVSPRLKADLEAYSEDKPPHGDARYALYDSLRELLEIALQDGPRALIIDDLHFANGREIHLLSFLVRSLVSSAKLPLLLVTTLRPKASTAADSFATGEDLGLVPHDRV
jgi:serine/threonine protein kinase